MDTLVVDLGLYSYGSNPEFTILFEQEDDGGVWSATNPASSPLVHLTDGLNQSVSVSLTPVSAGKLTFEVDGGLMVPNIWHGRAYAGPGDGEASVDFMFRVERTRNP